MARAEKFRMRLVGVTAGGGGVVGGGVTVVNVSTAPMLVTVPAEFVAVAVYVATSFVVRLVKVSVAPVAPLIGAPFLFHCTAGAGEPVATTEKETVPPDEAD